MQRVRLYFLDKSIIDGFIEGTSSGEIRLIDLLNSSANKRRFGEAECITIKDGVQMIFQQNNTPVEEGAEQLEFLNESGIEEGREVPQDFMLDENLSLAKTINLSDKIYTVNTMQLVFAHSLSEFKGVQNERARAMKTGTAFDINVVTMNNYLCSGKVRVPAINRELPKTLSPGKQFVVLSNVKMSYVPSTTNLYRVHDHLILNTQLIKAYY
ncbi:MAG: hypothetical protein DRJ08_07670 [Acidobacteria bacterium]|nr:MAG: hypothetical protein DRJ14_01925 [Acidobacteriota bacterium]RLE19928.1 MAG: hypothetical protein DRJ08_07670 [Acidobacteriota bacterium]